MSTGSTKRVLVVEDQEDVARVLVLMLVQHGHTVEIARNGADGLVQVAAFSPDVVVLDLTQPDMRGETVALTVRKLKPAVRIVGITGGSIEEVSASVFDELLQKPFRLDALLNAL